MIDRGLRVDDARVARVRDILLDGFRPYRPAHDVVAAALSADTYYVSYGELQPQSAACATPHFALNLINSVCYLLFIYVPPDLRGQGHGWSLYRAVHTIAAEFGCSCVRQTPSGGRLVGGLLVRSRRDYLLARGYRPHGKHEVVFDLSPAEEPARADFH